MVAGEFAAQVRRAIDRIWNQGDLGLADRLVAADFVNHGGLIPDLVRGPEAIKIAAVLGRLAFPRMRIVVDKLIANDETMELRWTARATPASGAIAGVTFGRIVGGRIAESWTYWEASGDPLRADGGPWWTRSPAA
jgi:hypothetical protein